MKFEKPLIKGKLIKRYKRFLADIELENGDVIIAHCTNSGTMKTCLETGAEVYLSPADNPNRKTKFTWEMIKINNKWVGVNTSNPNKIAYNALKNGTIEGLTGFNEVTREVKWGNSRFDLMARNKHETCFVEVKNVSMKDGEYAKFPDAVTSRGRKHLTTLIEVKQQGLRAVMLYVVQRTDVEKFTIAGEIDPDYANTLQKAIVSGVEVFVVQTEVLPESIEIIGQLPFVLHQL
jgi:sugar fermentation stimulation protein A